MKITPVEPGSIDLVMRENDFTVYYLNKQLFSPAGNGVSSDNQRVLKQLIMEACFRNMISDEFITVFAFLSVISDFLAAGKDPFLENFGRLAEMDPFLKLREGGISAGELSGGGHLQSLLEKDPILLNMLFWGISGLLEAFSHFTIEMREKENAGKKLPSWKDFMQTVYMGLPEFKKAVVNLLSFTHGSAVVLPILLAEDFINGMEYVNGLSAIHLRFPESETKSPFSIPMKRINSSGYIATVLGILDDVRNSAGFLACYKNASHDDLKYIISKGEGYDLEFKSTLRWDLKAGKTNQQVERASLKTISAFLNSNGGILLIGVRDDGSLEGIESDRFPNTDKFLLHLWTLVRTSFGTDVSPYIQTKLELTGGKTICKIKCIRASRPVFLRQPGFEEEFYIRVGPGTVALAVSEALKYISDHFPDRQKI
jgi:hypothetical protein